MKRRFNITGSCSPQKHYMVPLDDRLKKIKTDYVDEGSYFIINKGRQYGKTTTLCALGKYLSRDYILLSLDFHEIYGEKNEKFLEEHGRKFFLLYLKPIINGTGNYYVEAQTRDARRTDVIVDYCGEQFIIELKIWRGNEYNERGERQPADYLDFYHKDKGYMISFNFSRRKIP